VNAFLTEDETSVASESDRLHVVERVLQQDRVEIENLRLLLDHLHRLIAMATATLLELHPQGLPAGAIPLLRYRLQLVLRT
jgi:hypothetical protein